jgi:hypothetical protein
MRSLNPIKKSFSPIPHRIKEHGLRLKTREAHRLRQTAYSHKGNALPKGYSTIFIKIKKAIDLPVISPFKIKYAQCID